MPPLNPATIPNLQCWWDASDPATFSYSSGTLVAAWNDKGPAARTLYNTTPANQPSRSGSKAGMPTVVFDGNRLLVSSVAAPFDKSNVTIFVVAGETSHPQDYSGIFICHAGSAQDHSNGIVLDVGYSGTTHFGATRNDVRSNVPSASFPMPFAVYTGLFDTSTVYGYENGVTSGVASGAGAGVPAGMGMGSRFLAGAYNQTYGLRGEIAEVLIYSRTLTTVERQQVEAYLKEKWVLPLVLADTVTVTDFPPIQFFKPTDLTGCKLWFDASILGTTGWTNWPNLGTLGGSLAGAGTPAPQTTTPQAGLNGQPVMRYVNGQGYHMIGSGTGVDKEATLVVVCRLYGGSNQRGIGGVTPTVNHLVGYHAGVEDIAHVGAWLTGAGAPDGGGPAASTNPKLYSLDTTGNVANRFFVNGVLKGTGGGTGWAGTFAFNQYSGQQSNIDIAEAVLYDRKLTDLERQQVENYLRQKWLTPGAALTLGPADGLADTVALADEATVGFSFAVTMPPDAVTVTDVLGLEVSISFADGVNVSDADPIWGAAHFVEPAETVTVSDLFGTQIGEYITPCTPDPIAGNFESGEAVVGTWFACAKKGILGLGAYAPALVRRDLAAEPAGLQLGGEGALFVGQKPTIPGGGMYLGAYAPGFSLMLTPPLGALGLRARVPLSVGLTPPIYPAGLELGGSTPKFAGREPPVEAAALALGGIVPAFKFSQTLATPAAGLQLGGGIPVQVEEILILPAPEYPVDLLPVNAGADLVAVGAPSVDLLSSPAAPATLGDVEDVPSDDLNEVECV